MLLPDDSVFADGYPAGTQWWVQRSDSDDLVAEDATGNTCFVCDFDSGLKDSVAWRVTTHKVCSCQYQLRWGVPCRHMLHLWMSRPNPQPCPFLDLFNVRWVKATSDQLYDYKRSLGNLAPPAAAASVTTEADQTPASPAQISKCYNSLMAALDKHGYRPDPSKMTFDDDEDFVVDDFIGSTIVFKYGTVKWYLARVLALSDDMCNSGFNCRIYFWLDDEKIIGVGLRSSKQVTFFDPSNEQQAHPRESWLPVKEAALHLNGEGLGEAHSPARSSGSGRPKEARFAPAYGPMAKGAHKKQKRS